MSPGTGVYPPATGGGARVSPPSPIILFSGSEALLLACIRVRLFLSSWRTDSQSYEQQIWSSECLKSRSSPHSSLYQGQHHSGNHNTENIISIQLSWVGVAHF